MFQAFLIRRGFNTGDQILTKLLEGLEEWLWVASKSEPRTMKQNWGGAASLKIRNRESQEAVTGTVIQIQGSLSHCCNSLLISLSFHKAELLLQPSVSMAMLASSNNQGSKKKKKKRPLPHSQLHQCICLVELTLIQNSSCKEGREMQFSTFQPLQHMKAHQEVK